MAILNLSKATTFINMADPNLIGYGKDDLTYIDGWNFFTPSGNYISAQGTGFTFDAAGRAITGTVSSLSIAVGFGDLFNPDIVITGIDAPATRLDDGPESFWRFLEGNDTIIGPSPANSAAGYFTIFGDGVEARTGSSIGGNDFIEMGTAEATVYGDVLTVGQNAVGSPQASYRGGADVIRGVPTARYQSFTGDVFSVTASGKFTGGNDSIFIQSSNDIGIAIGDVRVVKGVLGDLAEVVGGHDSISAGVNFTGGLYGDVATQGNYSTVLGGKDTIYGGGNDDHIVGDVGIMDGGTLTGGSDVLRGNDGNDYIVGEVVRAEGGATVTGGNDTIYGGAGDDKLHGETGVQSIAAISGGDDVIYGEAGGDFIYGQTGNDQLYGGDDNDRLEGGTGYDLLNGGSGADVMLGGLGDDIYVVDDTFDFAGEAAGEGIDTVLSLMNNFTLNPNLENLTMLAAGNSTGIGNALNNVMTAGGGDDGLAGRGGDDRLIGGAGADQLHGEDGDDMLDGGAGIDQLWGGTGLDAASYASAAAGVVADLVAMSANTGDATGDTYLSVERLSGSAFNDSLRGDDLGNALSGGGGGDYLYGRGGDDVIIGASGRDTMSGGNGFDRFDFNALAESRAGSARDIVRDFLALPGAGAGYVDRLDFSTIDARTGAAGNQAFAFIGAAAFTGEGQIRAVQSGANTLIQVNASGTSGAEMEVLLESVSAATLTAVDFLL